jgi:alpha-methylacyl-CoA racemase
MAGPLQGINVVELAGLGAAPFCGMVLADLEQRWSGWIAPIR